jgi:hypothetical protein
MEEKKTSNSGPDAEPALANELRELGTSLSALGRTAFKGGRVLSVELLRSVRGIVDRAREEVERLAGEKK